MKIDSEIRPQAKPFLVGVYEALFAAQHGQTTTSEAFLSVEEPGIHEALFMASVGQEHLAQIINARLRLAEFAQTHGGTPEEWEAIEREGHAAFERGLAKAQQAVEEADKPPEVPSVLAEMHAADIRQAAMLHERSAIAHAVRNYPLGELEWRAFGDILEKLAAYIEAGKHHESNGDDT